MKYDINEAREWAFNLLDRCVKANDKFAEFLRDPEGYGAILDMDEIEGIYSARGCTRFVIWDDCQKYVLKIQYNEFAESDYCEAERYIYQKAVDNGVANYFAWNDMVGMYHGTPIYVMEYCDVDYDEMSDSSYEYAYKVFLDENDYDDNEEHRDDFRDSYDSDDCDGHEGMLDFAGSIWGIDERDTVRDFLNDFRVNDCHCGNYGYTLEGKLVICDYAGYGKDLRNLDKGEEDDE